MCGLFFKKKLIVSIEVFVFFFNFISFFFYFKGSICEILRLAFLSVFDIIIIDVYIYK